MPKRDTRPWGRVFGLLSACLVTLVGVARNLDPLVILQRAAIAGVSVGILAAAATALVGHLTQQRGTRSTDN